MPVGLASPYHVHHNEDEAFYVLEGELAVVLDGKWLTAGPGTYVYGPRDIPHGFKVVGTKPARMLLMCAPAGFERFVRDLSMPLGAAPAPPDVAKLVAAAATCNIDILGPLPEQP
jgi:oxalate decarboxylase/phosphoglucose isomerase-like protein (cupin superfamily)